VATRDDRHEAVIVMMACLLETRSRLPSKGFALFGLLEKDGNVIKGSI
jgi:hypothetical protein